jgi:uncharacterized membrane protein YqhA
MWIKQKHIFIRKCFQEYRVKISVILLVINKVLMLETKIRNKNLTENNLLECLLFSVFIICVAFPAVYLRRNIPVTNEREMSFTIDRICAEYFNPS